MAADKHGSPVDLNQEIFDTMYGLAYCDKVLAPASVTYSLANIKNDMKKRGIVFDDQELEATLNKILDMRDNIKIHPVRITESDHDKIFLTRNV